MENGDDGMPVVSLTCTVHIWNAVLSTDIFIKEKKRASEFPHVTIFSIRF